MRPEVIPNAGFEEKRKKIMIKKKEQQNKAAYLRLITLHSGSRIQVIGLGLINI